LDTSGKLWPLLKAYLTFLTNSGTPWNMVVVVVHVEASPAENEFSRLIRFGYTLMEICKTKQKL
jgi:hypothetical protein